LCWIVIQFSVNLVLYSILFFCCQIIAYIFFVFDDRKNELRKLTLCTKSHPPFRIGKELWSYQTYCLFWLDMGCCQPWHRNVKGEEISLFSWVLRQKFLNLPLCITSQMSLVFDLLTLVCCSSIAENRK
jgi:hypothetical protein